MAPRRMPPARGRTSSPARGKPKKAKTGQKRTAPVKAVKKGAAKIAAAKAKTKAKAKAKPIAKTKSKLKIGSFKKSAVKKSALKKGSAKAAKPAAAKTKKAQTSVKDARISATSSRRQNRPVAGRRQATNGRSAAYTQTPDFGAETRDQDTVDTYRGNQRQAPVRDDYVYERDSATETHPDQLIPGQTGEAKVPQRGNRDVSPQSRDSETESITPEGDETLTPAASSVEHFNADPDASPDKKQDDPPSDSEP